MEERERIHEERRALRKAEAELEERRMKNRLFLYQYVGDAGGDDD